ncbi:virion structural protein [Pseudomonas phage PhiPA3]|uniref:Virion structural protein n=1 Tax=Pseudomonas phage PhiPA3 TaxID=998086 RepID=F8SJJ3_BPPA3|nr:virion structural protein [Pseudomonas phage PhiPA3]AEH03784.1 virion structural protein [Pseudomonas phage PhiPA3]
MRIHLYLDPTISLNLPKEYRLYVANEPFTKDTLPTDWVSYPGTIGIIEYNTLLGFQYWYLLEYVMDWGSYYSDVKTFRHNDPRLGVLAPYGFRETSEHNSLVAVSWAGIRPPRWIDFTDITGDRGHGMDDDLFRTRLRIYTYDDEYICTSIYPAADGWSVTALYNWSWLGDRTGDQKDMSTVFSPEAISAFGGSVIQSRSYNGIAGVRMFCWCPTVDEFIKYVGPAIMMRGDKVPYRTDYGYIQDPPDAWYITSTESPTRPGYFVQINLVGETREVEPEFGGRFHPVARVILV